MNGIELPKSGSDVGSDEMLPDRNEAYIDNIYYGKERLTRIEALNQINMLSGMLLADNQMRNIL